MARRRLPLVRSRHLAPILASTVVVAGCIVARVPPPDSASAETVAGAYLDALVAGDCAATEALLLDPAGDDMCGLGRVDAYRRFGGSPVEAGDDVSLGVTLTLSFMPRTSGWPDGASDGFIRLVRRQGGPWRVAGIGSGP